VTPRRFAIGPIIVLLVPALVALGIGVAVRLSAADHSPRLVVVDRDGNLSTMDGHGGSVVLRSVPGTVFQFPAWSPDGSRIAALGEGEGSSGVYVFSAATGAGDPPAPTVIYQSKDQPPFYLYWTPDGRQLTFLTTEATGLALRLAPADEGGHDTVIRLGAPMYWSWLDAGRLEVHGGLGPQAFLGEIGLDGGSVQNQVATPGVFRAPAVSGDGRYRSYVATQSGSGSGGLLIVAARDGSASHEIPIFGLAAFGFDPTGTALAFIAADEATDAPAPLPVGPLRIADAASGSVRTVLDASVIAFFWAPDGRTIASLRLDTPGGIEARSVDGRRFASAGQAAGPQANLAQAGGYPLHLVFTDVASGASRAERPVRISELFATQLLPFFDQYALSHRLWSPDGASIVLPLVDDGGGTALYVIRADGSEPSRLVDAAMGFWSPSG
jgi:TolB protein